MHVRDDNKIIILLILLCFVIRISYIFLYTSPEEYIVTDMGYYDKSADAIVNGRPIWAPTFYSPAFYLLLSIVYSILKLVGLYGLKYQIIPVLNCLLSSLTVFFVYKITEKLSSNREAFMAGIIYCFYYPLIYLNIFIISENFFMPLFLASLYIIICKSGTNDYRWTILLGILLGLSSIIRLNLIFFIPLFLLWYVKNSVGKKNIIILSLVLFLIISSQILYNYYMSGGRIMLSSLGGLHFTVSWCDITKLEYSKDGQFMYVIPPANIDYPEKKVVTDVEFSNQLYYYRMGLDCIRNKPSNIFYNLKQVYRLFESHIFPRFSNVKWYAELFKIFRMLDYLVLIPFSLLSIYCIKQKDRKFLVFFGLLFASLFLLIYLLAVGEERYLIPYKTIFIILGSIGLYGFIKN